MGAEISSSGLLRYHIRSGNCTRISNLFLFLNFDKKQKSSRLNGKNHSSKNGWGANGSEGAIGAEGIDWAEGAEEDEEGCNILLDG